MRLNVTGFLTVCLVFSITACSIKKVAVNSLGDALAESSSVYASDNDLQLVREALPFGLKTIEALIAKAPRHKGLLLSAAGGFTQYSYAFVQMDADEARSSSPAKAREERLRAKNLYLRARDYALRALELKHPGFADKLRKDAVAALAGFKREEVPELYWTAVSWAGAISADKEDMDLVADLNLIAPIAHRCLELEEGYAQGAIHEFLISFEGGRSESQGGSAAKARKHFQRALELSAGRKIGSLIALAEAVCVASEERGEFEQLLQQVLAFDVNTAPEYRLANLVAQKRARFLLSQIDDLFL
jgi:predicted anti-sigma-YlaC factor YlaD